MSDPLAADAPILHWLSLAHVPLDKMSDEELHAHLTKIKTMSQQPVTLKAEIAKEDRVAREPKMTTAKKAFLNDLLS